MAADGDWPGALPDRDRPGRDRAASMQVGAVLLFGFIVLALSLYQAKVVPAENEGIEYNHNQDVRDEMIDVRNALLETRQNGETGYATVDLGLEYPSRAFAINPPNPAGTLRTTSKHNYTVRTGSGNVKDVCPGVNNGTRFLEYAPAYNELNAADIVIDNTVVYEKYEDGTTVTRSGQEVVDASSKTVALVPIVTNFSKSRTSSISVEPEPGALKETTVDNPTIKMPTRLDEQAWEDLLDGEVKPGNVTVDTTQTPNEVTIELGGSGWTVECGPVGINKVPPSGGPNQGGVQINPAAPGDIELDSITRSGKTVSITFNNTANTSTNITKARVSFYGAQGSNKPNQADISNGTSAKISLSTTIGDPLEVLDPEILLAGGTKTTVDVDFSGGKVNNNDWFVLKVKLSSGETATYFIDV